MSERKAPFAMADLNLDDPKEGPAPPECKAEFLLFNLHGHFLDARDSIDKALVDLPDLSQEFKDHLVYMSKKIEAFAEEFFGEIL